MTNGGQPRPPLKSHQHHQKKKNFFDQGADLDSTDKLKSWENLGKYTGRRIRHQAGIDVTVENKRRSPVKPRAIPP